MKDKSQKLEKRGTEPKTHRENFRTKESIGTMIDDLCITLGKSRVEIFEEAITNYHNIKKFYR